MRVLQVASGLHDWGGIERYVTFLTEGLAERGHNVTVSCPASSPLDQRIKGSKVNISAKGKWQLSSAAAYLRFFKANKFDVVHNHFNPDFILPMWAAHVCGMRNLVLTRHLALPWSQSKIRLYTKYLRKVIPVSNAVRDVLLESGIPASMLMVAKAGTPSKETKRDRDAVRAELGWGNEFVAGFFGRLSPEKGLDVMMRAASQTEGIRWVVFGKGPLEGEIKSCAQIQFKGFVPEVDEAMAAVDAVVVPSTWAEAFPYSALEAMSLARPIIGSRIGGIPEIVEDNVNGKLFEAGNADSLALAVHSLASDRQQAIQMGLDGQKLQKTEYTIARMAERIEAVYETDRLAATKI